MPCLWLERGDNRLETQEGSSYSKLLKSFKHGDGYIALSFEMVTFAATWKINLESSHEISNQARVAGVNLTW